MLFRSVAVSMSRPRVLPLCEISRETILEQFGLDQSTEALRMEHEEEVYDDIFKTQIPFAAPGIGQTTTDTGDPKANGAQGGRPVGGGKPSGDTTKPKAKTPTGATKKGTTS